MVGGCNRDRVHTFIFENVSKVFLSRRSLAPLLPRAVGKLFQNIVVHIAHMRDARRTLVRLQRREMSVPTPVKPDHGKVEPVIRTEYLAITPGRSFHGKPRR